MSKSEYILEESKIPDIFDFSKTEEMFFSMRNQY